MATLPRKHLAIALSKVPDHPAPDATREQVRTPGVIAADLLLAAHAEGDIEGGLVADLGCGTGVLAIGAALLGARVAVGVDIDAAVVAAATAAAHAADVSDRTRFLVGDVSAVAPRAVEEAAGGRCDAVVMNPPFGADLASRARGGDRPFLALAFRLAPVVWTIHPVVAEGFLAAFSRDAGYEVARARALDFPLPARFLHHKRACEQVPVGFYRFTRASGRVGP